MVGPSEFLRSACPARPRILTHGEDLDGLTSAALLVQSLGEVELSFAAPDEASKSGREWDAVLDLPLPASGATVWVDHHPPAAKRLRRAELEIVDPRARSAAELLWGAEPEEHPGMEDLVELTSKMDSGNFGMEGARFAAAVKRIFRTKRGELAKVVGELIRIRPSTEGALLDLPTIRREFELILLEAGDLLSWFERADFSDSGEGKAVLVDLRGAPGYLGVVALAALAGRADVVGTIGPSGSGAYRVALRTREGSPITALKLARLFGGGGHPHAAGARLRGLTDLDLLLKKLRGRGLRVELVRPGGGAPKQRSYLLSSTASLGVYRREGKVH